MAQQGLEIKVTVWLVWWARWYLKALVLAARWFGAKPDADKVVDQIKRWGGFRTKVG